MEVTCKSCGRKANGNKKKKFCTSLCRLRNWRESQWININKLTEEQKQKLIEIYETKRNNKKGTK